MKEKKYSYKRISQLQLLVYYRKNDCKQIPRNIFLDLTTMPLHCEH